MINADIFNKFTKHLKNALKIAGFLAKQENLNAVEPIHLLQGILKQPGSLAAEILHKNGLSENHKLVEGMSNHNIITLELSAAAQKIITKMLNLAFEYRHLYVGTEHLLLAIILLPDEKISQLFQEKNIPLIRLQENLETILNSTSNFSDITDVFSEVFNPTWQEDKNLEQKNITREKSLLELFSIDLTSEEIQQKIDPVIGRQSEIERLIQILSRRHKNNPLLLGDPGVGKTAIVEGLAKKIVQNDVPEILKNKKILNLDLGLMLAGTMYRGEFEARLKNILEEIKQDPNIIIFIDELHNIIGAGSTTGGTMDAANIIKPALARGEIRCIGATTMNEYRKYIESDPALERRFQTIQINEPSREQTINILKGLRQYYENYHQVKISDEAILLAVDLSIRYQPEKFLPDKAIDLIDEAASRAKIKYKPNLSQKKLMILHDEIKRINKQKYQTIKEENYDLAISLKESEKKLKQEITKIENRLKQNPPVKPPIDANEISQVVAQITSIPLSYLNQQNDQRIYNLEKKLNQHIIGQSEAIASVCAIIKKAQIGLNNPNRPIGSFLFLGPSGVGKTELAKRLAQEYFGNQQSLIRIDMSEFAESFNISKLIGAPAGYVGYKEGGKITDAVRRRPYSVVLFDEIEKGHPDVFNLLLQILDEGHITDAEGRKINFKHTIIIMTSNLASDKFSNALSFGFSQNKAGQKFTAEQIKLQVIQELEQEFKPELLNRLDRILVFNALDKNSLKKIVRLQLAELATNLTKRGLKLDISPTAITWLAQTSIAINKGAREIRRNIEKYVDQPLADAFLKNSLKKSFKLSVRQKKLVVS